MVRPLPGARDHRSHPEAGGGHARGRRRQPQVQGRGARRRRDRHPRGLVQPDDRRPRGLPGQARRDLPRPPGQAQRGGAAPPLHGDRAGDGGDRRGLARPGRARHDHQRRRRADAGAAGGPDPGPGGRPGLPFTPVCGDRGAHPAHGTRARWHARSRSAPEARRPDGGAAGLGHRAQGAGRRLHGHGAGLRRPHRAAQGAAPGGVARGGPAHRPRDQEPPHAHSTVRATPEAPPRGGAQSRRETAPRRGDGDHHPGGGRPQAARGRVLALRAHAGPHAPADGRRAPPRERGGALP